VSSGKFTPGEFDYSINKTPILWNATPILDMRLNGGSMYFGHVLKIDLCLATSIESSCRSLLSDMAQHRSFLENDHVLPPFSFHT